MPKREKERDPLPENFNTLEEFSNFWDDHSLADYEDVLHPVACNVNLVRSTRMVPVEPELLNELMTYASSRGISCETLVNLWLRDDLLKRTSQPLTPPRTRSKSSQVAATG